MGPVHIGNKIKKAFEKRGMTVSEFSRRINKSRENIYSIFRRRTIDTGLLLKISEVLGEDLFRYYSPMQKEFQKIKKENELLRTMVNNLLKKGARTNN